MNHLMGEMASISKMIMILVNKEASDPKKIF